MFHSVSLFRGGRMPVLALALAVALSGCESKQDKAIDQAKKEAAKTGQPQQVVSVAKDGTTTTTIVQPPAPGQTAQATTTSTAPPPQGGPAPAPLEPKVSPVAQEAPKPVSVTIPAGTNLAIRVDQRISVKTNHAGDTFTGEVVEPISDSDGNMLVPKGAPVGGVVEASKKRGRFKGASVLDLRLTSMTLNGTEYKLRTADLAKTQEGQGQAFGGHDWRRGGPWNADWRHRLGRNRTADWRACGRRRWNCGCGTHRQQGSRHSRGIDCALQAVRRSGRAAVARI